MINKQEYIIIFIIQKGRYLWDQGQFQFRVYMCFKIDRLSVTEGIISTTDNHTEQHMRALSYAISKEAERASTVDIRNKRHQYKHPRL